MLYELKRRNLAKAIYLAVNYQIDADNMIIHSGDTIKEMIFFESLFSLTKEKTTEKELRDIVAQALEDEHLNYFFTNELPGEQEKLNFIAYMEYRRYIKKRN
jgi:hypothetical protein